MPSPSAAGLASGQTRTVAVVVPWVTRWFFACVVQGAEGVLRFTETQSVATQRLLRFGPMLGLSDERYAKVMAAQLKLLKKLGRA